MLKKSLALAIALLFVFFIMLASRKTIIKFILLILPFSIGTKYGQINTYIVIAISACFFALPTIRDINKTILSRSVYVFFSLFIISTGISFIINLNYLRFDDGFFTSPHVQAIVILLSCLFLFKLIADEINSQEDIYEFVRIMVVAYLLSSGFAILQIINPAYMQYFSKFIPEQPIADSIERGVRVYGTLGGYELFAEYSGIVFLSSCCMALVSRDTRERIIWLCVVFTSMFMLFMTKSRGPILSLLICASYLIIFNARIFGYKRILFFLFGVMISIGITYIAFKDSKYNIIDGLLKTNIDVSSGKFDTRSEVWKYGYNYILSMSFINQIFGVGPGLISRTALLLYFPHNIYIYLMISLGLFGTILYLFWFIWIGFSRQGKPLKDNNTQLTTIFFKAIIIFFVVDQMKIEYIRVQNYQQIIWAYFALIYMQIHRISVVRQGFSQRDIALSSGHLYTPEKLSYRLRKLLQFLGIMVD